MSTEENKKLTLRFIEEVINQGKLSTLDELITADAVDHSLPPGIPPGREEVKLFLGMIRTAFPDFHETVEDIIAEGDTVVTSTTWHGTHQGAFLGIAPTGKQVSVSSIDISRVASGKFVEHWQSSDNLGLLQQLGVVPSMG
jgi:predicted SnoaL-like aldol condensation-catalyzing enzyme